MEITIPKFSTKIYKEDLHSLWKEFFSRRKKSSNIERQLFMNEYATDKVKWSEEFDLKIPLGETGGTELTYEVFVEMATSSVVDRDARLFSDLQYEMIKDFYYDCICKRYIAEEKSRKEEASENDILISLFFIHQALFFVLIPIVGFIFGSILDVVIISLEFLIFGIFARKYKPKDIFKHMLIFWMIYFTGHLYSFPDKCPEDNKSFCIWGIASFIMSSLTVLSICVINYIKLAFHKSSWRIMAKDKFSLFSIFAYTIFIVLQTVSARIINDEDFMKIDFSR